MQLHRPSRREWQNLHLAMFAAVLMAVLLVAALEVIKWLF
jgi:hypothetical protein